MSFFHHHHEGEQPSAEHGEHHMSTAAKYVPYVVPLVALRCAFSLALSLLFARRAVPRDIFGSGSGKLTDTLALALVALRCCAGLAWASLVSRPPVSSALLPSAVWHGLATRPTWYVARECRFIAPSRRLRCLACEMMWLTRAMLVVVVVVRAVA